MTETETLTPLTLAQTRALYWLAKGKTVKQITILMGISRRTVASHISSAKYRLAAHSRDEAVALAVQCGLLEIEVKLIAQNDNIQGGGNSIQ